MIQYILLVLFGFIAGIILPILPVHIASIQDGGYGEHNIKRFFYMGAFMYMLTIMVLYGYGNFFTNGIILGVSIMLVVMFVLWHRVVRYL